MKLYRRTWRPRGDMKIVFAGPGEKLVCDTCGTALTEDSAFSKACEIDERWCRECSDYRGGRIVPANALAHPVTEILLTKGYMALIDTADLPLVSGKWHAIVNPNTGKVYAAQEPGRENGRRIGRVVFMHRAILGITDPDTKVDHRDSDGLNNVRDNLRIATNSQNGCNRGVGGSNTSGFKGVSFHAHRGKWHAEIMIDGKATRLGYFETATEAAVAYDKAATELHGEFARLNFPEEGNAVMQELSKQEVDLAALAQAIVADVMSTNRTHHAVNAWLRPQWADKHLQKAIRHVMTAQLIRDGHEHDQEGVEIHLRHAVCRIMMAIACDPIHCNR